MQTSKAAKNYVYLVSYAGGLGENVWDGEMQVEADDIQEAVSIATPMVYRKDGRIVAIEQM